MNDLHQEEKQERIITNENMIKGMKMIANRKSITYKNIDLRRHYIQEYWFKNFQSMHED